jgi:hypothetical protein
VLKTIRLEGFKNNARERALKTIQKQRFKNYKGRGIK